MFTAVYRKYMEDNQYKILSESARFCRRWDDKHLVRFGFAIPIAVHLQKAKTKFHKVV